MFTDGAGSRGSFAFPDWRPFLIPHSSNFSILVRSSRKIGTLKGRNYLVVIPHSSRSRRAVQVDPGVPILLLGSLFRWSLSFVGYVSGDGLLNYLKFVNCSLVNLVVVSCVMLS